MLENRAIRILLHLILGVSILVAIVTGFSDEPLICICAFIVAVVSAMVIGKGNDRG